MTRFVVDADVVRRNRIALDSLATTDDANLFRP